MFTAFSTALSALDANTTAIDVVSNNLANLNTTGYKASVVSFQDLVTESIGAGLGATQVGFGTGTPFTVREFSQGATQSSTGLLDGAIQGDGFFIVKDNQGAQDYTRAGNFQVDDSGYLVTQAHQRVQGWSPNAACTVDTNQPIGDLPVPVGTLKAPIASQTFSMNLNLNSAGAARQLTGTFSTPINVVDSFGNTHTLTLTFTKEAPDPVLNNNSNTTWDYQVTIPDADVGTPQTAPLVSSALDPTTFPPLVFNTGGNLPNGLPDVKFTIPTLADGAVVGVQTPVEPPTDPATFTNVMTWQLSDPTGAARITQYNATSAPSATDADGSAPASLTNVALADGGKIVASYSNGTQVTVGQLAVASIPNPQSLIAIGNNAFQASAVTALPSIGLPESGGRGKVLGGSLESSTVDIAKEFTNLIVFQRAYQVNARVVTTVDQISQDTVNLKQ
jgi:flagellar hook protein FlgE